MSSASLSPSILFWPTLSKILGFPPPPQTRSSFGSSADTSGDYWALSRTVSWTLAMSLTIVVLRWVRERVAEQKSLRDDGDDDNDVDHQRDWQLHTLLYADLRRRLRVWYSQCRWFVQRAATAAHNCFPGRGHQRTIEPDWTLVTHTGSCQCRAVRFQVKGPRSLRVKEQQKGKLRYPQTCIKATCFRLLNGGRYLRTYQAMIPDDDHPSSSSAKKRVTHSFCSYCAVPICLAESSQSTQIILNVNCLDSPWIKLDAQESGSEATTATTTLSGHTQQNATRMHTAVPPSPSTPLRKGSHTGRKVPLPQLDMELSDENNTTDSASLHSIKGRLLSSSSSPGTTATLSTTATGGTDYMSTVTMGLFSYANHPASSSVSSSGVEWPAESESTPPRSVASKRQMDPPSSPSSSSLSAFAAPSLASLAESSSSSLEGNPTLDQSHNSNEFSTRDQLRRYMAKHLQSPTSPGNQR